MENNILNYDFDKILSLTRTALEHADKENNEQLYFLIATIYQVAETAKSNMCKRVKSQEVA